MKNNTKGFTLIELIAAVTIMAIIGTIVIVNFNKISDKRSEKEYDEFKREVENAACVYADLDNQQQECSYSCTVTAGELIDEGLISSDLINPRTKTAINRSLRIYVDKDYQGGTGARGGKKCEIE